MAKKVFNMQGGLHSAAAYSALENRLWGTSVASAASFVVSAGAGMNVNISTGDGLISVDAFNARRIQVTATETAAVPAANATFNRIDTVVAYIDNTVTPSTAQIDNTNNILKFMVVAGTAAATPVAPTDAAIQAAIGAGNPYMPLYNLLLAAGATNVSGITLTDRRVIMTTINAAQLPDGVISTSKVANNAIDNTKLALGVAVQTVAAGFSNVVTGTTTIPFDDTPPQQTEGVEGMTLSITPKSATNILVVEAELMVGTNGNAQRIAALFRDALPDALAAKSTYVGNWVDPVVLTVRATVVAGSTNLTTFKTRFGSELAATYTMNGSNGGRRFGAADKSSMKITEYKAA